jgi:hypothetical protein
MRHLCIRTFPLRRGWSRLGRWWSIPALALMGSSLSQRIKYISVTYLICENDKVVTPDLQRRMVETAKRGSTMEVHVVSCTAGHGVNISMPEAAVEAIRTAAGLKI